jgi:hypothetical protein
VPHHPPPTNAAEWSALARYRTIRILRQRQAATIRQLDVKICESGPAHIRPQPHILAHAIDDLEDSSIIQAIPTQGERETPFYVHAGTSPELAKQRIDELLVFYRLHRWLAGTKQYCGDVLEDIVRESFAADPRYVYQGRPPSQRPLDAAFHFSSGNVLLGIEVKNVREWLYPANPRIWPMLSKCVEIDAVPVLVTRKVAFLTRQLFTAIGVLRLEFHRQVFSQLVASQLEGIRHTDLLGYKDVIALPSKAHPTVVKFASEVVPRYLESYSAKWKEQRERVRRYADDFGLAGNGLNDKKRRALIDQLLAELGIMQHN